MVSLAAEFAVASELCRRGLYAQLTLGNKKRTDLLVHDEETNNFLRIEVKGKQTREWPGCKGIYGKNVMMVFVDYMNKKESERADFFVLTVEDWRELVTENAKRYPNVFVNERNVAVWTTQLSNGKPYEGTGVKVTMIEKYREAWDKIIKAIRDGRDADAAYMGLQR
jgi:hypothetical protein